MDPNKNQPQELFQPIIPPPTSPHPLHLIKTLLISLAAVLILASIAGGIYFLAKNSEPQQAACTMEAKICPDGTGVSRTGPKCEFALCPTQTPNPTLAPTEEPKSGSSSSTLCIQVITPAKNNSTNECREFSTPCDVPQGWTKVSSCAN